MFAARVAASRAVLYASVPVVAASVAAKLATGARHKALRLETRGERGATAPR